MRSRPTARWWRLIVFFSVLKRTEMLTVNVEELNYLAKRLESFDTGEAAQFQAMAHKLELFELKDLINLTFCCQQATVITDFFRPRRHRPRPLHEPARRQRKCG